MTAPRRRSSHLSVKNLIPPSLRVAKRALLSWRNGEPELHLLPLLCSPALWSVDVGANTGIYTWHLARWSAGVTAFEPQPAHAAVLRGAFGARVSVEQVALSDGPGEALLRVPTTIHEDGRATIEEGNTLQGERAEGYWVPRRALDSYALPKVGLIKIDVEGHELAVLKGSQAILERDRPNLIIEAEDRHHSGALENVCSFLAQFGYEPCVLEQNTLRPLAKVPSGASGAAKRSGNFVFLREPPESGT